MALPFKIRLFLQVAKFTQPPMYLHSPAEARRNTDKGMALGKFFLDKPEKVKSQEDQVVQGRHGEIPIRIYFPENPINGRILTYIHGGGFVINNIQNFDYVYRRLCNRLGAVIVAVGYRLSPENKFPIPLEDCYDAVKWSFDNATKLNADPNKLILGGDSAGGNLSAAVTLLSRDSNDFKIAAQILIYPSTDSSRTYPSTTKYANGYLLTKDMMDWFTEQYIRSEKDLTDPRFSVLLSKDLGNLPPALVLTAGYDPLKDEGEAYAKALEKAGTTTQLINYPNLVHGFITFPLMDKQAMGSFKDIHQFINDLGI